MLITINKVSLMQVQVTDLCYGLHGSKPGVLFLQHIQLFQFRLDLGLIEPVSLQ